MAGATLAIERFADRLVQGVRAEVGPNRFAEAIGIRLPDDPAKVEASAVDRKVALAAVALATATQNYDNPFSEPVTKKLIVEANGNPAITHVAVSLWSEADTYREWHGSNPNTRPRGMSAVWRAVIERPPSRSDVLASIANSASAGGYSGSASARRS
jgi:hypothetical protein